MKPIIVVIMWLGFSFFLFGGEEKPTLQESDDVLLNRLRLTAQLQEAVRQNYRAQEEPGGEIPHKSVAKAVIFSAAVPGTGQFYAKSYIKAGLFLAIEAGAWLLNLSFDSKGDSQTDEFEAFADQNWSEYRYWSYINYLAVRNNLPDFVPFDYDSVSSPYGKNWYLIDPADYTPDAIEALRRIENAFHGHSHELPHSKTQQYYEMIGKYPEQFGNAWADASFDEFYRAAYGDPGRENITAMNARYVDMRNEANRLYRIAGYGAMLAVVNHIISAIDAGFTTQRYNRRQVEMTYRSLPYQGEYVNMFGVNVSW